MNELAYGKVCHQEGMSLRSLYLLSLLAAGGSAGRSAGEYVAKAGDCTACHTAPGGAELAGGMKFPTPLGAIYATNITPDKLHGIGAIRSKSSIAPCAVAKDGHQLYPAMPYTSYAKMGAEDMRALYDYLMNEVPAQNVANRDSDISWPLSMRWPLAVWNQLFTTTSRIRPIRSKVPSGTAAPTVQGAGHCGSCHAPRGWAMREKGLDGKAPVFLSGAELDGWYASIYAACRRKSDGAAENRPQPPCGGRRADERGGDPRYAVSQRRRSERHRGVPAQRRRKPPPKPLRLPCRRIIRSGKATYAMYCSTCHGNKGEGTDFAIPALAGNATVTADNPLTALRVVLEGRIRQPRSTRWRSICRLTAGR